MNFISPKSFHYLSIPLNISRIYSTKPSLFKVSPKKIHLPKNGRKSLQNKPETIFLKEIEESRDVLDNYSMEQFEDFTNKRRLQMKFLERKEKLKIIERRYFQSLEPPEQNLLTWDMKEHLLHLNSTEPETWNPVTLSQAFPISQKEVNKLLKSTNKPGSAEKLKQHDLMVLENWKKLTKGEIGNLSLLKKTVLTRIREVTNVTVPCVQGTTDEMISTLENLKFTSDGELFDHEAAPASMPKWSRKKIPFSFKTIITDYERQREGVADEKDPPLEKCRDLTQVLPHLKGIQVDDNSSGVTIRLQQNSDKETTEPRPRYNRSNITFEDFMRRKSFK